MAITAFLELRVKPEALDQGLHAELHAILSDTRAFEGCLGVEVLTDTAKSATRPTGLGGPEMARPTWPRSSPHPRC